jgi:hypothetical protein
MPYTHEVYDALPWWRKFSERWSTALGYLAIAMSVSLGAWSLNKNSSADIRRNEDTVNEVVCGLKFFVSDLIEAGSNREAVLQKLAARLPASTDCVEAIQPEETIP